MTNSSARQNQQAAFKDAYRYWIRAALILLAAIALFCVDWTPANKAFERHLTSPIPASVKNLKSKLLDESDRVFYFSADQRDIDVIVQKLGIREDTGGYQNREMDFRRFDQTRFAKSADENPRSGEFVHFAWFSGSHMVSLYHNKTGLVWVVKYMGF